MLNSGCSTLDVGGWSLASGIALRVAHCVSRGENQINPQSLPAHGRGQARRAGQIRNGDDLCLLISVTCLPSVACKAKEGLLFSSPETKKAMLLLNTAFFIIIKSVFN